MTVYVDDVRHRYRGMIMCHMWADSQAELLAMADRLPIERRWLQKPPKASWEHFDVSLSMKMKAVRLGAVLTDKYGPLEHAARLDISSGDPQRLERGARRLEQIANVRAMTKAPA